MRPLIGIGFVAATALLASLGSFAGAQGGPKKVKLGDNVFLEVDGEQRRVLINAYVCLRQGVLEQVVTRKRTKEHEAILAADVDARNIHLALVAAKAMPGSPVKFRPKFEAPTGTPIKITLEYKEKGKAEPTRVAAQQWVRNIKTRKD